METLKIRKATLQDASAIIECVNLSYEKYIPRIGKKPQPMLGDYPFLIEKENVFLGEWAGQIVGMLYLKDFPDHVVLDAVAVYPSFQGKGFGKSFIEFAENYTAQRGNNEIRLYTNIKMYENVAMYKKLGFIETEIRWEDGYHRVYFRKPIAVLK